MITARFRGAPEVQGTLQANPVFLYRQLSSALLCGHQRERDGLMAIASQARRERTRVVQGLTGSQRDDLDRYYANSRPSVAIDQRLANLPAFANGVHLSRSGVAGIEASGSAIGKGGQNAMRLRHCESGGDKRVWCYGHREVSLVDALNIGPMALTSQEEFSA